ncbi:hypothetical protein OVA24_00470 [Luteolibacter sp. SL250]|uniref:hypothetical protein n=1 Tax=Luteolibacter sp. SL250 TaxID=2995170 RepID=UPI002270E4AC|nr:hypothetical protein [Luteolibacter sp. SL250]WAC19849.1 hypothetical protein OVA24_00470 [Luteolibacter sp. SL250]
MKFPFHHLLPCWLVCASISQAASTYQENFPQPNSGNLSHSNVGWTAVYGTSATDGSANTTNNANGGFVVSNLGGGYGAKTTFNSTYGLAYTTEVISHNITTADITTISFLARNGSGTDRYRIVLAIDVAGFTEWFASDTFFTTTGGVWADGAQFKELAFTTAASSWRSMTVTTSALSVSDSTLGEALPSGNLIAAGLFLSGANDTAGTSGGGHANTMRYDDFTVNAVPEPSAALLGIAGSALLVLRRKARNTGHR